MVLPNAHVFQATSNRPIPFAVALSQKIHANQIHAVMERLAMRHAIPSATAQNRLSEIHSENVLCPATRQSNYVIRARAVKMPIVLSATTVNYATVIRASLAIRMCVAASLHEALVNRILADPMHNASSAKVDRAYVVALMGSAEIRLA